MLKYVDIVDIDCQFQANDAIERLWENTKPDSLKWVFKISQLWFFKNKNIYIIRALKLGVIT